MRRGGPGRGARGRASGPPRRSAGPRALLSSSECGRPPEARNGSLQRTGSCESTDSGRPGVGPRARPAPGAPPGPGPTRPGGAGRRQPRLPRWDPGRPSTVPKAPGRVRGSGRAWWASAETRGHVRTGGAPTGSGPSHASCVTGLKRKALVLLFMLVLMTVVFCVFSPEILFSPQAFVWILLGPWTEEKSIYPLLLSAVLRISFLILNGIGALAGLSLVRLLGCAQPSAHEELVSPGSQLPLCGGCHGVLSSLP